MTTRTKGPQEKRDESVEQAQRRGPQRPQQQQQQPQAQINPIPPRHPDDQRRRGNKT